MTRKVLTIPLPKPSPVCKQIRFPHYSKVRGRQAGAARPEPVKKKGPGSPASIVFISTKAKPGSSFHRPGCPLLERLQTARRTTQGRALKDGFRPCTLCHSK